MPYPGNQARAPVPSWQDQWRSDSDNFRDTEASSCPIPGCNRATGGSARRCLALPPTVLLGVLPYRAPPPPDAPTKASAPAPLGSPPLGSRCRATSPSTALLGIPSAASPLHRSWLPCPAKFRTSFRFWQPAVPSGSPPRVRAPPSPEQALAPLLAGPAEPAVACRARQHRCLLADQRQRTVAFRRHIPQAGPAELVEPDIVAVAKQRVESVLFIRTEPADLHRWQRDRGRRNARLGPVLSGRRAQSPCARASGPASGRPPRGSLRVAPPMHGSPVPLGNWAALEGPPSACLSDLEMSPSSGIPDPTRSGIIATYRAAPGKPAVPALRSGADAQGPVPTPCPGQGRSNAEPRPRPDDSLDSAGYCLGSGPLCQTQTPKGAKTQTVAPVPSSRTPRQVLPPRRSEAREA